MGIFGKWWGKSGPNDRAKDQARSAAQGDDEVGLDARVSTLLTEFERGRFGLGPTGAVDYATCREAVLTLHSEVADEPSRMELLRFYGALMSVGVEGLRREGRDPSELEALWRGDYYTMLTKEAVTENGDVDEQALDRVIRREREAGRLGEGESLQIQPTEPWQVERENGRPTARAIGERAIALWTAVVKSMAPTRGETLLQSIATEGGREWLTEKELSFLLNPEADQAEVVAFGWQAERLVVLLWAVGRTELPADDAKCDPVSFAPLIPPTAGMSFKAFLDALRLRDPAELDAAAARINEAYWAGDAAEAAGDPIPPGIDLEILSERLRAVGWAAGHRLPEWP